MHLPQSALRLRRRARKGKKRNYSGRQYGQKQNYYQIEYVLIADYVFELKRVGKELNLLIHKI